MIALWAFKMFFICTAESATQCPYLDDRDTKRWPERTEEIKTCTKGSQEGTVAWLSDGASSFIAVTQDSVKRSSFSTTQLLSKQGLVLLPQLNTTLHIINDCFVHRSIKSLFIKSPFAVPKISLLSSVLYAGRWWSLAELPLWLYLHHLFISGTHTSKY